MADEFYFEPRGKGKLKSAKNMIHQLVTRTLCINLVSHLDSKMDFLERIWLEECRLHVTEDILQFNEEHEITLTPFAFVKLVTFLVMYNMEDFVHIGLFLPDWLTGNTAQWEETFESRHSSAISNILAEDYFCDEITVELCLWGLFKAIDILHKGRITYKEFSSFVVDGALQGNSQLSGKEIKPYALVRNFPTGVMYRVIHVLYIEDLQEFLALVSLQDGNLRNNEYPAELRYFHATTYQITLKMRWLRDYGAVTSFCAKVKTGEHDVQRYTIAAFADGSCRIFSNSSSSFLGSYIMIKMEWKLSAEAHTLCEYEPKANCLFLGSRQGELSLWDISELDTTVLYRNDTPLKPKAIRSKKVHKDAITGLILMPLSYYLITCSMDCTAQILVQKTLEVHRTFTGHKFGITCMALSREYSLLVTISAEYTPRVWSINVPHSQGVEMNDWSKPHLHEIIRVCVVPQTPQCITCDAEGTFKVWDLQTLKVVQTFVGDPDIYRSEKMNSLCRSFAYNTKLKQIVTSFRRSVYVFEYNFLEKHLETFHAHVYPIVGFYFMEAQRIFLTVSRHDVTMWDCITGQILRTESDCFDTELISAFCVDEAGRILYVGTETGSIQVFNISNMMRIGARFRNSERSELIQISNCGKAQGVVFASVNGYIEHFTEAPDSLTFEWRSQPFQTMKEIPLFAKGCVYMKRSGHLLVPEASNCVSTWTWVGHWKRTAAYQNHPNEFECVRLCLMGENEGFIVCDSGNNIHAWTLSGTGCRFMQCYFAAWTAIQPPYLKLSATVTDICFCDYNNCAYVCDDAGWIIGYDLESAVAAFFYPPQDSSCTPGAFRRGMMREREMNSSSKGTTIPNHVPPKFTPKAIVQWHAHTGCVTDLKVLPFPSAIVSCGLDCNVKIWSLGGNEIACLSKIQAQGAPFMYNIYSDARGEYDDAPRRYHRSNNQLGDYLYDNPSDDDSDFSPKKSSMSSTKQPSVADKMSLQQTSLTPLMSSRKEEQKKFLISLEKAAKGEEAAKEAILRTLPTDPFGFSFSSNLCNNTSFTPQRAVKIEGVSTEFDDDETQIFSTLTQQTIAPAPYVNARYLVGLGEKLPLHSHYVPGANVERILYGGHDTWTDFMRNNTRGLKELRTKVEKQPLVQPSTQPNITKAAHRLQPLVLLSSKTSQERSNSVVEVQKVASQQALSSQLDVSLLAVYQHVTPVLKTLTAPSPHPAQTLPKRRFHSVQPLSEADAKMFTVPVVRSLVGVKEYEKRFISKPF